MTSQLRHVFDYNCGFLVYNLICCFITALIIEFEMTGRFQATEMTVTVKLFQIAPFFPATFIENPH